MPRAGHHPLATLLCILLLSGAAADLSAAEDPVTVPRAELRGVDGDLADRVFEAMGDDELRCSTPRWIVRNRLGALESELRIQLRARGHHGPTFESRLQREEDCWRLGVDVTPGPQTRIREFRLQLTGPGSDDPRLRALAEAPGLAPEQVFIEGDYEALKQRFDRIALERGYFDSSFPTARVDVYPDQAAADVDLVFATGERHVFGELDLEVGPRELSARLLQRLTDWTPGAPYAIEDIQALRTRLTHSGYFEVVDVRARPEQSADGRVPVHARLDLRARQEVSGGVGFATDLGPRLHAAWENRYLNRDGHQADVRADLSPVRRETRASYRLPISGRGDPWLVLDAGHAVERTDNVDSSTLSVGVRRVHGGPWRTRMTEFLELSREDFDIATDDDVAVLLTPGISLGRSERRRSDPLEIGWRFETSVRGAFEPLSTTSFLQGRLDLERAFALGERGRLISRLQFGTTWADALAELPASIRFFAGGDRSLRGYDLDALGPENDRDEVRGGRHLAIGTLELEHMVWRKWSAAVFIDHGGAFNDFTEPVSTGIGVGIRWQSPFGPIRLDLAAPVDDPERALRLHLGVGSTFR
ncbi:MAG: autotransporter assembly complex family protein [Gammaproteobacteria bacterium]|nr:autotransporter assembly complex family protein [Gammaproteobacteria bacterium]